MEISSCILAWWLTVSVPAQTTASAPTTRPEKQWGLPTAGLSLSAVPTGQWTLGGELKVDLAVRNGGAAGAALPGGQAAFAWLLVAQGKTVYYTQKLFPAEGKSNWPARLDPGQELDLPTVDVAGLDAFLYLPELKLVKGYPSGADESARPARAGTLGELLGSGPVRVKCVLYLDRQPERPLSLDSRMVQCQIGLGDFAKLPPGARQKLLNDLTERFRKDAFSAKAAHADAVRIGRDAVPTLLTVARQADAPEFARMWAVTALADIGGAGGVATLVDCLSDPAAGVRHVAAFHGLKLKSDKFDAALNKLAISGDDPMLTAWALLGYLRFRGEAPKELLSAGPDSKEWRVRATVVDVIARARPDRSHLPILRKLVQDEKEAIRAKAAEAIGSVGDKSPETLDALLAGLAMEGDQARAAITEALSNLSGNDWRYDPQAAPQARRETLDRWQEWWRRNERSRAKQEGLN